MSIGHTIKSVNESLKKGEFSAEEIRKEYLKKVEKENPKLNAYLSVFEGQETRDKGQETRDKGQETRDKGQETRDKGQVLDQLAGVPCAIKDNILIYGEKCTAGSKILEKYVAPYDATVIERLKKSGAVFLGKANLDEFAMGSTCENSAFGPSLNPHDTSRVAGGSSGGAAVAVAGDLAVYALGSDTGGSIRNPASFCGVVGLKPTYGRVSRYGLIAMASSLDQIGPITKNVEDAAIVLNAIAGHDKMDSTTIKSPGGLPDFTTSLGKPIKGLKVAVPKEFFGEGIDSDVANSVQRAISTLEAQGAHIDEVSLPLTDYAIAVYYIIVPAEVSANMARYDGIKYGKSSHGKSKNLLDVYMESRAEGLGEEVRRRIMLGTYTLSAGYYDAYYLKAQKVRELIKKDFEKIFEKYDVIAGPTMPMVAPKLGELGDPLSLYLADIYTVQVNIAGLPAISVPCGTIEKDGKQLPVGLQLIGNYFKEEELLQAADCYEKNK